MTGHEELDFRPREGSFTFPVSGRVMFRRSGFPSFLTTRFVMDHVYRDPSSGSPPTAVIPTSSLQDGTPGAQQNDENLSDQMHSQKYALMYGQDLNHYPFRLIDTEVYNTHKRKVP